MFFGQREKSAECAKKMHLKKSTKKKIKFQG